ncbi:gamma-glutamyltransferase [Capsulimonas corticalis]|uniref:Glutathione hydrolase proenzyme n=1 Tax=Capsulimonas corticalis TaxID=2219043 RepID=A0A402D4J1_9BACT|nr:gamma-glutamyltransferase [Capsulimonas corticalis]BDI29283.1 gamma-glutamyltransferase [Capsulimonas corticalis]
MANQTRTPLRVARSAMVATGNAIATMVGVEILRAGGHAIDAAVAIGAAMVVLEPERSHLGGDVFLQYWDAGARRAHALNGSGAAPSGATREAMGDIIPMRGIRASAIPGVVDGWLTAQDNWGVMTASEALEPAIALAEDGYALGARQAALMQEYSGLWDIFPETAAALVPQNPRRGATLYQPLLAATLRDIAQGGRAAFYQGDFAKKLVAYSDANAGFFTLADLKNHRCEIADPIWTTYRGVTVTEQPPVSQGHLLLQMLNMIEGFDMAALDPEGAEAVHRMAEAKKLAFADRLAYMGDVPDTPLETLISKAYAERRRDRINPKAAAARFTAGRLGDPANYGTDTTSFCVIDEHGNAVTMIQSIFHPYGSGVVIPGTGVLMNNRMTGFSLEPSHPNALAPGKRPMHTLNTYMLLKDNDLWGIGGTPGGDFQVQTNLQVISQIIDHGRDPQEAIESPKWRVADDGPGLTVEPSLPLDACYSLRKLGHDLTVGAPWSGSCASQVILKDLENDVLLGGSDPRVEGLALGY